MGAAPGRIRYKDLNGDGKIDNFDQTWITEGVPDFNYGLNLGAGYKGFDVQLFLQGVQGLYAFNNAKFRTDFASLASGENWGAAAARCLDAHQHRLHHSGRHAHQHQQRRAAPPPTSSKTLPT